LYHLALGVTEDIHSLRISGKAIRG
jgi:hypothetical protein